MLFFLHKCQKCYEEDRKFNDITKGLTYVKLRTKIDEQEDKIPKFVSDEISVPIKGKKG